MGRKPRAPSYPKPIFHSLGVCFPQHQLRDLEQAFDRTVLVYRQWIPSHVVKVPRSTILILIKKQHMRVEIPGSLGVGETATLPKPTWGRISPALLSFLLVTSPKSPYFSEGRAL